jgi:alkaline phosphatase D
MLRRRLACAASLLLALLACASPIRAATDEPTAHGPILMEVAPTSAVVWIRMPVEADAPVEARRLRCTVARANAVEARTFLATPSAENDGTARFALSGLLGGTEYAYRVQRNSDGMVLGEGQFRTPVSTKGSARIVFGSCADIDDATAETWRAIRARTPDALVLIGDTPYIDTTDLATQRTRYRAFAAQPDFAALAARTPVHCTWDDHDIGANDTDGNLKGKENARRAFVEYRGTGRCGHEDQGVYSSFRHGPVEVFVLDTRWFARTEPSRDDAALPSLLGETQWRWLEEGLAESTAPVKVIASSMVFHDLASPTKKDHWGAYPHEFERLARFIGARRIDGVVLVSGDIHRSRVVRHATAALAGYDLHEFTTSPLHKRAFAETREGIAGLLFDRGEQKSFLVLEVRAEDAAGSSKARVVARIENAAGEAVDERTLEFGATPATQAP